jgi:hypothetical protein
LRGPRGGKIIRLSDFDLAVLAPVLEVGLEGAGPGGRPPEVASPSSSHPSPRTNRISSLLLVPSSLLLFLLLLLVISARSSVFPSVAPGTVGGPPLFGVPLGEARVDNSAGKAEGKADTCFGLRKGFRAFGARAGIKNSGVDHHFGAEQHSGIFRGVASGRNEGGALGTPRVVFRGRGRGDRTVISAPADGIFVPEFVDVSPRTSGAVTPRLVSGILARPILLDHSGGDPWSHGPGPDPGGGPCAGSPGVVGGTSGIFWRHGSGFGSREARDGDHRVVGGGVEGEGVRGREGDPYGA